MNSLRMTLFDVVCAVIVFCIVCGFLVMNWSVCLWSLWRFSCATWRICSVWMLESTSVVVMVGIVLVRGCLDVGCCCCFLLGWGVVVVVWVLVWFGGCSLGGV